MYFLKGKMIFVSVIFSEIVADCILHIQVKVPHICLNFFSSVSSKKCFDKIKKKKKKKKKKRVKFYEI